MEHSPQLPTSPPPKLYKPSSNPLGRAHDRLRLPPPLPTHPPARNKTPPFILNFPPPHQPLTRQTPTPSHPPPKRIFGKTVVLPFFPRLRSTVYSLKQYIIRIKLLLLKTISLLLKKKRLRSLLHVFFNRYYIPVKCKKKDLEVCQPRLSPPCHSFFRTYHYLLSSSFMTNRTHRQLCLGFGP